MWSGHSCPLQLKLMLNLMLMLILGFQVGTHWSIQRRRSRAAWHLLRREAPKPWRVGRIEACAELMPLERVTLGRRILRVLWGGT